MEGLGSGGDWDVQEKGAASAKFRGKRGAWGGSRMVGVREAMWILGSDREKDGGWPAKLSSPGELMNGFSEKLHDTIRFVS